MFASIQRRALRASVREGISPLGTVTETMMPVFAKALMIPKFVNRSIPDASKSFDDPKHKKTSLVVLSKDRRSSVSKRSDEPTVDEVATKAVILVLSGYAGKYLKGKDFRDSLRNKCSSCLVRRNNGSSDNGVFANMELGIESIEKLIDNPGTIKELNMKSLRNSIGILTIVADLNSKESRNGTILKEIVTEEDGMDSMAHRLLSAAVKLDRKPSKCVVFEDDPRGITAAHNCTMMAVGLIGAHPVYDLVQADMAVEKACSKIRKSKIGGPASDRAMTMAKSFEVIELPARSAKFIARKQWVVTGADDILNSSILEEFVAILDEKLALKYKNANFQRRFIRLEESANGFMKRDMTSWGNFAILQGWQLIYYIKNPEILMGRATEDVIVDVDLGREGDCRISSRQIRGMPFLFETNKESIKRYVDSVKIKSDVED
ncbi:hypothetical protein L2E82_17601 [Cichorium intybus]|uniref:Uncharacterized protein n=1 Tax=Cichorium intybus TaxID=13427 RepID=A0ACB9F830_CICIN|nr:hypothetical protein L2E82_17601 [Cichorium intybus]